MDAKLDTLDDDQGGSTAEVDRLVLDKVGTAHGQGNLAHGALGVRQPLNNVKGLGGCRSGRSWL